MQLQNTNNQIKKNTMEYAYQKLLDEYDLSVSDLPEEAKEGITQIKQIEKAIKMQEAKGNGITEKTIKKIKALDKWVCYEILDYVNDTEENDDEMPTDADEIKSDLKSGGVENNIDPIGLKIDEEFKALYQANKTKLVIEDIESEAPTAYGVLFDSYNERDKENGIETSYFKLVETADDEFTLTKR